MSAAPSSENTSEAAAAPSSPSVHAADATGQADHEPADIVLALSRSDRRFLAVSGGIILLLMGVYLVQSRRHQPDGLQVVHTPENELALRLDINTATWVEWMQMEGIGEALARNIVADRETHGPFRSVDDVSRVRGIGDAKMVKIRPYLQCLACPDPVASPESTSP
jgi:competence protein ComEA